MAFRVPSFPLKKVRFDPVCGLRKALAGNRKARLTEGRNSESENPVTESTISEDRQEAALLDVNAVAALLSCSTRHVYRLADAGRMPPPVKLGALVRWNRQSVTTWLAEGCPSCRKGAVK
jgi:excisionase family DNA binding protein